MSGKLQRPIDQAQAVLIASIGASREARSAGYQPNNIPTSIENSTAKSGCFRKLKATAQQVRATFHRGENGFCQPRPAAGARGGYVASR